MEYLEEKIARVMRSIRGSATLPDSSALLGRKPQQTVANTIASKCGAKSWSKGQLINTDLAGSAFNSPLPKCSRAPWTTCRNQSQLLRLRSLRYFFNVLEPVLSLCGIFFLRGL